MVLSYDLSKCAAWDTDEATREAEWHVTEGLIFSTMGVGLGSITEKNEKIFYARQKLWNRLFGFTPYTAEQIHSYVGLRTNAGDETEAAWRKRTMDNAMRRFEQEYKEALDKE